MASSPPRPDQRYAGLPSFFRKNWLLGSCSEKDPHHHLQSGCRTGSASWPAIGRPGAERALRTQRRQRPLGFFVRRLVRHRRDFRRRRRYQGGPHWQALQPQTRKKSDCLCASCVGSHCSFAQGFAPACDWLPHQRRKTVHQTQRRQHHQLAHRQPARRISRRRQRALFCFIATQRIAPRPAH